MSTEFGKFKRKNRQPEKSAACLGGCGSFFVGVFADKAGIYLQNTVPCCWKVKACSVVRGGFAPLIRVKIGSFVSKSVESPGSTSADGFKWHGGYSLNRLPDRLIFYHP